MTTIQPILDRGRNLQSTRRQFYESTREPEPDYSSLQSPSPSSKDEPVNYLELIRTGLAEEEAQKVEKDEAPQKPVENVENSTPLNSPQLSSTPPVIGMDPEAQARLYHHLRGIMRSPSYTRLKSGDRVKIQNSMLHLKTRLPKSLLDANQPPSVVKPAASADGRRPTKFYAKGGILDSPIAKIEPGSPGFQGPLPPHSGATDDWTTPSNPAADAVEKYSVSQGPPEPPAWVKHLGDMGDTLSNIVMAMDPAQSIFHMLGSLPGPQKFQSQHPIAADALSAITGLGLQKFNPAVRPEFSGDSIPVSRFQKESTGLSPSRRGGHFFEADPPVDPEAPSGTRLSDFSVYKKPFDHPAIQEGGPVQVTGEVNPQNPFITQTKGVANSLEKFIGSNQAREISTRHQLAIGEPTPENLNAYYKTVGKYGLNRKQADGLLQINTDSIWAPKEAVLAEQLKKYGYDSAISTKSKPEIFIPAGRNYSSPLKIGKIEPTVP